MIRQVTPRELLPPIGSRKSTILVWLRVRNIPSCNLPGLFADIMIHIRAVGQNSSWLVCCVRIPPAVAPS